MNEIYENNLHANRIKASVKKLFDTRARTQTSTRTRNE